MTFFDTEREEGQEDTTVIKKSDGQEGESKTSGLRSSEVNLLCSSCEDPLTDLPFLPGWRVTPFYSRQEQDDEIHDKLPQTRRRLKTDLYIDSNINNSMFNE